MKSPTANFLQMTTSQVHRNFVGNPISPDQGVETLPGIGPVYGGRLRDSGITTAQQIVGQYLTMNENREQFLSWLGGICNPQGPRGEYHMNCCYTCVMEWTNQHIH